MKMEPIERSETSASNTQTPGNYPKETVLHLQHSENSNLKSRILYIIYAHSQRVTKPICVYEEIKQTIKTWECFLAFGSKSFDFPAAKDENVQFYLLFCIDVEPKCSHREHIVQVLR
jgi:hypothetical protein